VRIIGVDPGLASTGYAVIDEIGRCRVPVEGGVCRTKRNDPIERRLMSIYLDIRDVLGEFRPDAMAVEDLHTRYRNLKTAIVMGHARGVVCLTAGEFGIPVFHYQPTQAKNLVTGSGRAGKEQVQQAVAVHLGLQTPVPDEHVADAFAIALCHAMMADSPVNESAKPASEETPPITTME